MTIESFAANCAKFAEKFKLTLDQAHRAIVLDLFNGIISDTPADTGRARNNWTTAIGAPTWAEAGPDLTGAASRASLYANIGKCGDTIFITNGLPYIEVLEYGGYPNPPVRGSYVKGVGYVIKSIGGYSKQAPAGMVRINIARVNNNIEKISQGLAV